MKGVSRFTALIIVLVIIVSIMIGYSIFLYYQPKEKVIRIATLHGGISSIDVVRYLELGSKYNIKIEIVYFEKTLDISNALMSKDVDMAIIPLEVAAKVVENGGSIYVVAADMYQNQKLILRRGFQLNSTDDLTKINIGVFTPTGTYAMFKAYMNIIYGYTEKNLHIVNLPPNLMVQEILKNDVDMIVVWEPFASIAISKGCKVYVSFEDLWKNATGMSKKPIMIVYVATKEFVDNNHDLIEKFLDMRDEAVARWTESYTLAENILVKYYKLDENASRILYNNLKFYKGKYISEDDLIVIKKIIRIAYQGGYLKQDISEVIANIVYHPTNS